MKLSKQRIDLAGTSLHGLAVVKHASGFYGCYQFLRCKNAQFCRSLHNQGRKGRSLKVRCKGLSPLKKAAQQRLLDVVESITNAGGRLLATNHAPILSRFNLLGE